MKLYFDIGNTSIKMNYKLGEEEFYISFKTKNDFSPDSLFSFLPEEVKTSKVESAWISSVVPNQLGTIERMIEKYFGIKPNIIKFPVKTGINFKATNPKAIGSDVISLSAFVADKSENGIIVNLGTATTITHIKNKTMLGTIFAPGIAIGAESLIKNASKLHEINMNLINKTLGNNTEECLSIGILKGHIHMIRGFIREIDSDADVFISGGNSKLVKDMVAATYVKEATIEGIKVIEKFNEK
ncbi:type III pantothenate kinase [Mycoplasma todarodis]|uniref:type III pantothenate kinase n=1 Tax=Mycoplasma todarodis TaxID=1937191 RepID=UPI003B32B069